MDSSNNSANTTNASYLEWGAILGGVSLACAVSLIFMQFGAALGFTVTDTVKYSGPHTQWRIVIVGLWLLWVQLMASMSGGYIAGRMRRPMGGTAHESEVRDGMHGLVVWSTATLVAALAASFTAFISSIVAYHTDTALTTQISPEMTRKVTVILGFIVGASSFVSAVAAWWMGTVGGDHRDKEVDFSKFISFRNTVKKR